MGTQFTSHLTKGDLKRVRDAVREARSTGADVAAARRDASVQAIGAQSAARAALAKSEPMRVTANVLAVLADRHEWRESLRTGGAARKTLDMLLRMHGDAKHNSFAATINTYKLDANPQLALSRAIQAEVRQKCPSDPFRDAAIKATAAILAPLTMKMKHNTGESDAIEFGRQFQAMDRAKLAEECLAAFVRQCTSPVLDRASRDTDGVPKEARVTRKDLAAQQPAARDMARLAVHKYVKSKGKPLTADEVCDAMLRLHTDVSSAPQRTPGA